MNSAAYVWIPILIVGALILAAFIGGIDEDDNFFLDEE